MSIIGIAASGLEAATFRLSAAASNTANADSAEPAPDGSGAQIPYTPIQVVQTAVATGGVRAELRQAPVGGLLTYQPALMGAPAVDTFAAPGVDLAMQAVEQMIALNAFKANLAVIRTAEEMSRTAIDTTA
jgi:flagellar basal-body rod protein FlgC